MDVESIVDEESLKAWLEALPVEQQREAAIYIASRAVLRVLPFPLCDRRYWGSNGKSPLLPLLRVIALLEVASAFKSIELATRNHALRIKLDRAAKDAEAEALAFVKEAGAAAARAPDDVFSNARALLAAVTVTGMASHIETRLIVAQTASAVALAAAAIVNFDTWPFVREDADRSRSLYISTQNKLWSRTHRSIPRKWDAAKKNMPRLGVTSIDGPIVETHGDWTFWVDWYEAHLAGDPFPASLLKDIVELPEDLWLNDPVELNRRVIEIYEAWKLKQRIAAGDYPYGARFDAAAGKIVSYPVETVDLSDIVKDIRQTLRDFARRCKQEGGHNKRGEDINSAVAPAIEELRKLISRHKDTPQKLFEALEARTAEIADRAKDAGLGEEPLVNALLKDLATSADKVCVAAPSVQQYQEDLAQSRLKRARTDLVMRHAAVAAGMWRESKGDLAVAAEFAVLTVLDPNASDRDRGRAYLFLERMPVRAALAKKQAVAAGEEVKTSETSLTDKLRKAGDVGKSVSDIDKGVDTLQEAVTEAGGLPWDKLASLIERLFGG